MDSLRLPDRCQRCHANPPNILSKFNLDWLCLDCKKKEKAHPKYAEADAAEIAAVRRGDYNFPGIGKPSDL